MNVVQALLQSRKAWVVLLAVVGVVVMELVGKIGPRDALDAIKWLVSAWLGAQAAEDAASRWGGPTAPPAGEPTKPRVTTGLAGEPEQK